MYQVQNPMQQAMGGMNQAAGTYGRMMPNIPAHRKPKPTAGGAAMSGLGGATTASSAGSALTTAGYTKAGGMVGGGWGMLFGAALGIGSYLLS